MGLYQEQTQKLVMTTQMKQAIELLQCSQDELDALLAEESLNNPFTEFLPVTAEATLAWSTRSKPSRLSPHSDRGTLSWEQVVQKQPSLAERLEWQIREMCAASDITRTAIRLIGYLNESGYLVEDAALLSAELGCPPHQIEQATQLLQACEPRGIAARTLKECLSLQIEQVPVPLQELVQRLINNHLEDIASGRLPQIAKQLKQPVERIQQATDALRRLHPKPGAGLFDDDVRYVIPDVTVHHIGNRFIVVSNDNATPTIRFNQSYTRLLQHTDDLDTQRFLLKKYHAAEWLIRCVEQRRLTLYRVAEAIVQVQHRFFEEGPSGLRPLTLRQVADEVGLHESTVSRATRGKYMQTPRGVFEMKFFFNAEVTGDEGVVSAKAAKHCIRTCVDSEDPQHPFSDEAVCQQLAENGIHISRRTVAKYREEMRIPSSARRKRFA
jgi:RNA polymerase sigma-54 factor